MQRLVFLLAVFGVTLPAFGQGYELDVPPVVLKDIEFMVAVHTEAARLDETPVASYEVRVEGRSYPVTRDVDDATRLVAAGVMISDGGNMQVTLVENGATVAQAATHAVPGWLSILPPFIAILIALLFKRVIPALFMGIWVGSWIALGFSVASIFGLLDAFQVYILNALMDTDRLSILLFTLMIGGMIGIVSRNGGTQGVVNNIVGWASTSKKGQLTTGFLGLAIFFDDYANTLVVGTTMRPVTDRLRISREKLAYIVDSTAAPVACLALVTTWIGYEVGIIGSAVAQIEGFNEAPYSIFLNSIAYSFYPLLALFFVFAIAFSQRDFGPMYRAEKRARTTGQVLGPGAKVDEAAVEGRDLKPKEGKPLRAINAILPILVLLGTVLAGFLITGEGDSLRDIIGDADSYKALMWGSLLGVLSAVALSVGQRILDLAETIEAWYVGLKSMLFAMIILVMAWSLSDITEVLHTADYLVSVLGDAITPGLIPTLIFLISAATAFATGSSWGTMGILMPLVIPLTWAVLAVNQMNDPSNYHIIYSAVSCVLAGSVWGDHCSPISDTTILSSMASGCDHIEHVRTQLPYALVVGVVALLLGTLPAGFGFPWWASLIVGVGALLFGLRTFGKTIDEEVPAPTVVAETAV